MTRQGKGCSECVNPLADAGKSTQEKDVTSSPPVEMELVNEEEVKDTEPCL